MNKNIHFIGCGGAGMAPLMYIMFKKGFNVSGSDLENNKNIENLRSVGAKITIGHNAAVLPENKDTLVVFSSAVKDDNPELHEARSRGLRCIKRGEMLAETAALYKKTLAISGSHGKTSVTAILAHILKETGQNPGYMVGGKVCGWKFSADAGNGNFFVTELDESDGTHSLVKTRLGIVTNVEDDHCWSVGGVEKLYGNFHKFASQSEQLIYIRSDITDKLFADIRNKTAINIEELKSKTFFQYAGHEELSGLGGFQRINAATAVSAAVELGIERSAAEHAALSFPGVERRMTLHYHGTNSVIIEDYAHHPTEVAASIEALREKFPALTLRIIFQPHRYARLQRYFNDFISVLSKADALVIMPVFAAWIEKSGSPVTSKDLAEKIGSKAVYIEDEWNEAAKKIAAFTEPGTVTALLAAGDADRILEPLKQELKKRGL